MYNLHPSKSLSELFKSKPYQGAPPKDASCLFVGLDANYSKNIEKDNIFPKICEYHDDGVAFWEKYSLHHPFLLPEYLGDGKKYHRNFSEIGFKPQHAKLISFIELLEYPTFGRSKIALQDLSPHHLNYLNDVILNGKAKSIFLSNNVANLMKRSGIFNWFDSKSIKSENGLNYYQKFNGKTIYKHLHFSVYGKFEQRRRDEAKAIYKQISGSYV